MKKGIVVCILMLMGIVAMGCSESEAKVEDSEIVAEVISTEELILTEGTEEASEVADKELEQALDEVELPYYSYEDLMEILGVNETEWKVDDIYEDYCKLIDKKLSTINEAFVLIAQDIESDRTNGTHIYKIKEQVIVDKNTGNKKPSSGSSGGNSSGASTSSATVYWEEPVRTPEEAAAARDKHNIEHGGTSSEDFLNGTPISDEEWEKEKELLEGLRGY